MVPTEFLFIVSVVLFLLGTLTVLIRKNVLVILMGLELMLNSVAFLFILYSRIHSEKIQTAKDTWMHVALAGQFFTLFIFVVAAVEVVLMAAIILNLFHLKSSVSASSFSLMKR